MNKGQVRKRMIEALCVHGHGEPAARWIILKRTKQYAKKVAIEGHSRYGKATAVAMAYGSRFAIAYIGSCGGGGAKINRRNYREIIENVAAISEHHWMAVTLSSMLVR